MQAMDEDIGVAISYAGVIPAALVREFATSLQEAGIEVEVEDRGDEVFASMEWLVPTAIVVFISRKYFETLMQEAAKDHYPLIKASLSRLLQRTMGRDREIRIRYLASGNAPDKLSGSGPGAVSIYTKAKTGQLIKFVFDDTLAPEQRQQSLDAIFALLRDHTTSFPHDAFTRRVEAEGFRSTRALLMRFDPTAGQWFLWHPGRGVAR